MQQLTLVETLPYPAEGTEVLYTNDPVRAESWLQSTIINNSVEAIGLDIEWKPQFIAKKLGGKENKTAVIQLSVEESCLVLHIFHMKILPPSLSQVLSNKNILKVGNGINGDGLKLFGDANLLCDGRVDTQEYAKALGMVKGLGLKTLSKTFLDIGLVKPKRITVSNWELFPLDEEQIHYAAMDAWISLKLFLKLREQLDEENEVKEHPKTVLVHYGEPALTKKTRRKEAKQKAKDNSSSSNISEDQTPIAVESNTVLQCPIEACKNRMFRDLQHVQQHINENHVSCKVCGKLYKSKVSANHKKQHREKGLAKDKPNPSHSSVLSDSTSCSISENRSSKAGVKEDKKRPTANSDTDFLQCPIKACQKKKFIHLQDLEEHIIKEKHVSCKVCGKLFKSKVSANHKKQHREQSLTRDKSNPSHSSVLGDSTSINRRSTAAAKEGGNGTVDSEALILYCPIEACKNRKFTHVQHVQQHINAKHVYCKICGKLFESKVSANHKKQHRDKN